MIKSIKILWVITIALAAVTNARAESINFESGLYENLLISVNANDVVTGYYQEAQGEGVVKSCTFSFSGGARSGTATITVKSDESVSGTIQPDNDAIHLKIPKARELPGCGLVLMPEIADGLDYDLIEKKPWRELRTISKEKAYFHSEPRSDKKQKSYLIKGDVVGVVEKEGEWLHIDYYSNSGKFIRRWIQDADTNIL